MKRGSKADEILTLLFMVLAVGAFVCFLVFGKQNPTWMVVGGIAMLMRIAQYIMRFF